MPCAENTRGTYGFITKSDVIWRMSALPLKGDFITEVQSCESLVESYVQFWSDIKFAPETSPVVSCYSLKCDLHTDNLAKTRSWLVSHQVDVDHTDICRG
ncbi:hypothetical protein LSAT2_013208 [Lamellibrachia satsuma]|nr:hypothetical protein LSAT2_013208 [Lamellibrachia satsuma]